MDIKFFRRPADFRKWLEKNHEFAEELWVGFYKTGTDRPSITWPESVDQALCFGWIDGVRKRIDDESYKIRFTRRKAVSTWSAVNTKRFQELVELGLVHPLGVQAFDARRENRSGIYSYEQRRESFDEPYASMLKANPDACAYFLSRPPWYRRAAIWWVVSAKQEATRMKRMGQLIDDSAHGRTIPPLTRNPPAE
jgi:uncharacterized protein YdeI (YjbR/CyaY-like superfamily)